jgi:hypothetical protein
MAAPRTWRSWYCGSSLGCCAARPAAPGSPQATGSCSPPAVHSPDSGGHRCSSRRRRCALAPHTGPTEAGLRQGPQAWQATDRPADRRTDPADGQGERPVGLRADLWGAAQARHPGRCHDHQDAAATTRPGPGAATLRTELGAVSSSAGRGVVACDLLHGGDDPAQDPPRGVLHPPQHQAVVLAGVTANPELAWVTQQARNVATDLNDQDLAVRIVLRDHDAKFTRPWTRWTGAPG